MEELAVATLFVHTVRGDPASDKTSSRLRLGAPIKPADKRAVESLASRPSQERAVERFIRATYKFSDVMTRLILHSTSIKLSQIFFA